MAQLTIIKQNHLGREVWRYPGELIARDKTQIVINAKFTKQDFIFEGMPLKYHDLFYEIYFKQKWYNIFEIYDRDDGKLKGWYCNVTYPARIRRWDIVYRDLALDLLVFSDGTQKVLDFDEFEELELNSGDRLNALSALDELKEIFQNYKDIRLQRDFIVKNGWI